MEEKIKSRFTPTILAESARRYGVPLSGLEELNGFESFIYRYEQDEQRYILRIAHSLRRSEAMIRGEADWINYLVDGGVSASRVIESGHGNLVEPVEDGLGGKFLATVFEHAPGIPPWEFGWDDALYRAMGITAGRMHRLTKSYRPTDPLATRPQWDDPIMLMGADWLPDGDTLVQEKYDQIVAWCRTLGQSERDYGLIHFDMHGGNFFVDGTGSPQLFDFDDCHYGWFANDIAIVLFYMALNQEDQANFALNFIRQFVVGYSLENRFEPEWLEQLPAFMKMREIDLYGVIHRSFDVETMEDEWNLRYMAGRRERIERDVPFIDADFTQLADSLPSPRQAG